MVINVTFTLVLLFWITWIFKNVHPQNRVGLYRNQNYLISTNNIYLYILNSSSYFIMHDKYKIFLI